MSKEYIISVPDDAGFVEYSYIRGGRKYNTHYVYKRHLVRCEMCEYKRLYDDGETKYCYCALEDRPNRQWSVDDTDFCSWGERRTDADG